MQDAFVNPPTGESNEATAEWLAAEDTHLLSPGDDAWPPLLSDIPGPPKQLYLKGDPESLSLPSLAIVGSRNPTRAGERNAYEFAHELASMGFCIASGLAQGIDTAAHKGALEAGGKTIAFLGHGIDRVYPAANRELAHRIAARGVLASEFPLGSSPRKENFPQRNRLISGVSVGTLVVEAAKQSGSLITARLAGEQGREIFAIPGSIHNPLSKGCHQLIRSGARLVESVDDILAELRPLIEHLRTAERGTATASTTADDSGHQDLLNIMGFDPVSLDELSETSGLTIDQLSSMLLILELEGKVERLSGGRFCSLHRSDSPEVARSVE